MTSSPEAKTAAVLQLINDRIVVTDSEKIAVFVGDFVDAGDKITTGDAAAILNRLQKNGAIRILEIGTRSNSDGGYTLENMLHKGLFTYQGPSYNLERVDRNRLNADNLITFRVEPNFLEICTTSDSARKIILAGQGVREMEDHLKSNPMTWSCPIDRSNVALLLKPEESIATWMDKFARGEYGHCKDRRHPNRFWIEDGKIRFGTVSIPVTEALPVKKKIDDHA